MTHDEIKGCEEIIDDYAGAVYTLTNPAHYPRMLVHDPKSKDLKDYAAEALSRPREAVEEHLDQYEHFGNRRLRTVGELIQEAFRALAALRTIFLH